MGSTECDLPKMNVRGFAVADVENVDLQGGDLEFLPKIDVHDLRIWAFPGFDGEVSRQALTLEVCQHRHAGRDAANPQPQPLHGARFGQSEVDFEGIGFQGADQAGRVAVESLVRSEEHTSELQS